MALHGSLRRQLSGSSHPGVEDVVFYKPDPEAVHRFEAWNSGKMFAVSVTTAEPLDVSVKCDPDLGVALRRDDEAIV